MLEASELVAKKQNRSKKNDLPDWALTLWDDLGKPDFSEFQDIRNGPLLERRTGLRRDDLVEILIDARALPSDMDPWMRGRLMGTNKLTIELLTADKNYHYISRDVIVDVCLVAHMRAAYIDDRDLLNYEREDMKRRNSLHEEVEKDSTGADDSHVWG